MSSIRRDEWIRFIKFGAVGVSNTAITFFLYWGLRIVGVNINLSNMLSYIGGAVNSFVWGKCWVFQSKGGGWLREALLFSLGLGVCWALQWVIFTGTLKLLPELWAQVIGMGAYTLFNYMYNRFVTFHKKKDSSRSRVEEQHATHTAS